MKMSRRHNGQIELKALMGNLLGSAGMAVVDRSDVYFPDDKTLIYSPKRWNRIWCVTFSWANWKHFRLMAVSLCWLLDPFMILMVSQMANFWRSLRFFSSIFCFVARLYSRWATLIRQMMSRYPLLTHQTLRYLFCGIDIFRNNIKMWHENLTENCNGSEVFLVSYRDEALSWCRSRLPLDVSRPKTKWTWSGQCKFLGIWWGH